MATVPNWIAKGYAVSGYGRNRRAYAITSWRATQTQVIVSLDGLNGECRFRLDDLTQTPRRLDSMRLVAPDDESLSELRRLALTRRVRRELDDAIDDHLTFMRTGDYEPERVIASISNVQRAATKAMADLADLL